MSLKSRTLVALALWLGIFSPPVLSADAQGADTATTTVILVRHAEKAPAAPGENNPRLSPKGQDRAEALREAVTPSRAVIYATSFCRTQQTAAPLAQALGVPIRIRRATDHLVPPGCPLPEGVKTEPSDISALDFAEAAKMLRARHGGETVIVVGHSNTVPRLATAFGAPIDGDLPDDAYDDLFILTLPADGSTSMVRARYGAESP